MLHVITPDYFIQDQQFGTELTIPVIVFIKVEIFNSGFALDMLVCVCKCP